MITHTERKSLQYLALLFWGVCMVVLFLSPMFVFAGGGGGGGGNQNGSGGDWGGGRGISNESGHIGGGYQTSSGSLTITHADDGGTTYSCGNGMFGNNSTPGNNNNNNHDGYFNNPYNPYNPLPPPPPISCPSGTRILLSPTNPPTCVDTCPSGTILSNNTCVPLCDSITNVSNTCPASRPWGYVDVLCNIGAASGWTYDPVPNNNPALANTTYIQAQFYIDGIYTGETTANQYRSDLGSIGYYHGFTWTIPSRYLDGLPHSLIGYAVDGMRVGMLAHGDAPLDVHGVPVGSPVPFTCSRSATCPDGSPMPPNGNCPIIPPAGTCLDGSLVTSHPGSICPISTERCYDGMQFLESFEFYLGYNLERNLSYLWVVCVQW